MKGALFIVFALVAISWQSVSAENSETFIVSAEQKDCHGPFLRKCLQVREESSESWRNFYDGISGFDYEPGYEYVLKVKTEDIPNPPADGSSVEYTLLEQVSKTKV